ncbi:hypothetical protein HMPREF1981_03487 [Bacteroides pyogenes F0041]|uniref:Uncharacterized protein n=1 Tax=Bacteroides pyogenes F0041 TaxID=1321819 RepID=U2DHG0_9BACE|nr:hypothetical protein HMPREF1981_03487 [Bacteroides pyogenes F0041]
MPDTAAETPRLWSDHFVSHRGNKSFPSRKIKFPQWETKVSIVGNKSFNSRKQKFQ